MSPTRMIVAVSVALTAVTGAAAQQPPAKPKRINRIIEQVEAGRPAIVNCHWDWIEMEIGSFTPPVNSPLPDSRLSR